MFGIKKFKPLKGPRAMRVGPIKTLKRIKEGFRDTFRSIRSPCGLSPVLNKVQNSSHGLQHCEGPQTKETINCEGPVFFLASCE